MGITGPRVGGVTFSGRSFQLFPNCFFSNLRNWRNEIVNFWAAKKESLHLGKFRTVTSSCCNKALMPSAWSNWIWCRNKKNLCDSLTYLRRFFCCVGCSPPEVFLWKCVLKDMQKIYRRMPMHGSFIEVTL